MSKVIHKYLKYFTREFYLCFPAIVPCLPWETLVNSGTGKSNQCFQAVCCQFLMKDITLGGKVHQFIAWSNSALEAIFENTALQ